MTPPGNETSIGGNRLEALLRREAGRSVPVAYEDLVAAARDTLADDAFDYIAGGAGAEHSVSGNRRAFDDWQIRPAMLRGIDEVDLSVDLFDTGCPVPLWLSPIGAQTIAHEDGEVATASAAGDLGVPMMVSSVSSRSLEAVAGSAGDAPCWFQLYPCADETVTESFLQRATAAEYEAIVVTVDTPAYAWRERDLSNGFHPQVEGHRPANYFDDPAFRSTLDATPEEDLEAAYERFHDLFSNPHLDWDDIADLTRSTDLPVLVKGILRGDDARRAVECGADGVVVSNHGGRQVDRAVPSLHALPEVVDEVADEVPVLLDGGIRRGSEAFIALALGADAVCLGRPYIYGLAVAGANGVKDVLANVLTDFHSTLAQTGHGSATGIDRDAVTRRGN
ncbi:MAG: alpha-hydroxy-acid oxidizing protein [Halovenus sp.]